MASFAQKVKSNPSVAAAAKAVGVKAKDVASGAAGRKEAKQRVQAYMSGKASAPEAGPSRTQQLIPGGQPYSYATTGGNAFGAGFGILGDLATRFQGNEIIGGEIAGSLINAGQGLANVGLADLYTRNTFAALGDYNSKEDTRRTGNLKDLMSTEAALNSQTIRDTGEEQRKGYVTQGEQERLTVIETGAQQRLGFQEQGSQERETLGRKGLEERKMRADARGAIRSQGARFYG
jgi:hypothetical protein